MKLCNVTLESFNFQNRNMIDYNLKLNCYYRKYAYLTSFTNNFLLRKIKLYLHPNALIKKIVFLHF